jgi:hypothetical protein
MVAIMRTGQWVFFFGLLLLILPACKKEEPSPTASVSPATTIPTEEELWEERRKLKAQHEDASFRYGQLKQNIGDLEVMIAETTENLQRAQAEKEKLLAVEADLKKRWEKELEGYGDGCVDGAIIDIYRRMVLKSEDLLRENRDLKRRLEEAENQN